MAKHFYLFITLILLSVYGEVAYSQTINDHIFPAAATAKPYIDFDSKGFLIKGKRTFIVSAGLEYARIPHQLWYDRLLRIKRAGFNCVEIYTIWNFHEAQDGQFDFTGDRDLNAFLTTVKNLGMYAILRVGPYYCAEWDNGGYPVWLKFKKDLSVREDNKPFEKYVDRFFDHLLPVVFKNQVNNGGAVIMVQLENEHKGWGTIMPDAYFTHLQSKALSLGLQVPYFFSGLHHASDPAGDGKLDDATRPNPWFSTEFWSVWYSQYGSKPEDAGVYDRRTWKIIAHGGNGYNYYMVHGGSNFGYTNNDEDAASYDYGAAIGQTGDLRPIYYTFKRAAWFARSFQDVLENSTDATASYHNIVADTALKVTARTSAAGDLIFLDNPSAKTIKTNLVPNGLPITVAPGELYPLVHQFKINAEVTLDWAYNRVFAVVNQHETTTLIVEAEKDMPLSLHFLTKTKAASLSQPAYLKISGNEVDLEGPISVADKPAAFTFTAGTQIIRILVMDRQWTDKTWIVDSKGEKYIISGTGYPKQLTIDQHQVKLEAETPLLNKADVVDWVYTANKTLELKGGKAVINQQQPILKLGTWAVKNTLGTSAKGNNQNGWLLTKEPAQMGADGDITPDAWYRTTLDIPSASKYTLQVKGNGRGQAYVDGKPAAEWTLSDGEVSLNLKQGQHNLAIFAAHDGRDKLAAYIGPIDHVDSKGIFGNAVIKQGGPFISELHNWYFAKAENKDDVKKAPPEFDTIRYKKYKIGDDAFHLKEGFGWFRTEIPQLPAGTSRLIVSFKSVDENATVFINGKQVSNHQGWNIPFEVTVSDPSILKGPVIISVFIENYSNEGGIDQPVKINTIGDATAITGWQMKGGPGDWQATQSWQPINSKSTMNVGPSFYQTRFTNSPAKNKTMIWRVDPKGMGHGSIWVNGHNLGRYPEKTAAPGLYIPECWLKNGVNELVIYDEDGKQPTAVKIKAEPEASRITNLLTVPLN